MTSYIFSSDQKSRTSFRLPALFGATTLMLVLGLLAAELAVREGDQRIGSTPSDVESLMAAMPTMRISGREIGNQMLVHNVAMFSRHPAPDAVSSGYVGTSRSKVLRPGRFGLHNAVVGAGNTYNEITYGLLAQAEVLRLEFPNIKRIYVESSLLLRRPARLIVEPDHQKYIPIIQSFESLCSEVKSQASCRLVFDELSKQIAADAGGHDEVGYKDIKLLANRSALRFTSLLGTKTKTEQKGIPVFTEPILRQLDYNGERKETSRALIPLDDQVPKISNENIKVQRLRDIVSNAPWDGLFDLFAVWGRTNDIDIVFFQPPVRSDLYDFQLKSGLATHVADMERISRDYGVVFIDLNRPELNYMNDWQLFSDEDHMETCIGSGLLTLSLEVGYQEFLRTGNLMPKITRGKVESEMGDELASCQ